MVTGDGRTALVLDFDGSVTPPAGATTLDLADWQETIRFGCSIEDLCRLETFLEERVPAPARVTYLGSGDFHHVTYSLIRRRRTEGPFQVLVFDNHPDNMRYPWGIHCGSWVHHVCTLPFVSKVTVVGITSGDVASSHLWENRLRYLYRGKLTYLCFGGISPLGRRLGIPGLVDFAAERTRLPEALAERVFGECADPIYLTIDKDVLAPSVVQTNWDQGTMQESELLASVRHLSPRVFAADVTGDISFCRYSFWWKWMLARLDGQSLEPPPRLPELRAAHHALNDLLLEAITGRS